MCTKVATLSLPGDEEEMTEVLVDESSSVNQGVDSVCRDTLVSQGIEPLDTIRLDTSRGYSPIDLAWFSWGKSCFSSNSRRDGRFA